MALAEDLSQIKPALEGIKVIDSDTHLSEPYDLWTSRAPAKYRDRMPRVKKSNEGGGLSWIIEDDISLGISMAQSAIHKTGRKSEGLEFFSWMNEDVAPGSYDLTARLAAMDDMGVHAQVVYPNVMGFGGQKQFLADATLRQMSVEIYNDAMAEMQADSKDRIFPMAMLPWWDIAQAVKEAERCAKMGLKGINTHSAPQEHGLPDLSTDYWGPLWEAAQDLDLPINFHIAGSDEALNRSIACWPSFGFDKLVQTSSITLFMGNAHVLANMLVSGFLHKFPKLKIVSVESGIGWIPFLLEIAEYQMRESGVKFDLTPEEIFARQIYACSWFERKHWVEDVRRVGVDNVMFESDYPHPTCLYPEPLDYLDGVIRQLTPEERRKVFSENAARVYNIPV